MKFLAPVALLANAFLCKKYDHEHPFHKITIKARSGEKAKLEIDSHNHCQPHDLTVTFLLVGSNNAVLFPARLNTWRTVQQSVGVDYNEVVKIQNQTNTPNYSSKQAYKDMLSLGIKKVTYNYTGKNSNSLYVYYIPPSDSNVTFVDKVTVFSDCRGEEEAIHGNFTITVNSSKALSTSLVGLLLATILAFY